MAAYRNNGHGHDALDTPPDTRPVHSDSWRKAKGAILGWIGGVAGLIASTFIGAAYLTVADTQQRLVRLETKMDQVERTLDRIENNTMPQKEAQK